MLVARSPTPAYVAMFTIGVGAGATFPSHSYVASERAPTAERGQVIASFLMFNDVGQSFGGPLSGGLSDRLGITWVFVIPIVVMVGGLGVALSMRDTHRDARPIG